MAGHSQKTKKTKKEEERKNYFPFPKFLKHIITLIYYYFYSKILYFVYIEHTR